MQGAFGIYCFLLGAFQLGGESAQEGGYEGERGGRAEGAGYKTKAAIGLVVDPQQTNNPALDTDIIDKEGVHLPVGGLEANTPLLPIDAF